MTTIITNSNDDVKEFLQSMTDRTTMLAEMYALLVGGAFVSHHPTEMGIWIQLSGQEDGRMTFASWYQVFNKLADEGVEI